MKKQAGLFKFLGILTFYFCIMLIVIRCTKSEYIIEDTTKNTISDDKMMNPGPDPEFINYQEDIKNYKIIPLTATSTWERYLYVDKTDTLYNSTQGKNTFSRYLRKYGFTGVYLYSTSGIVSSTSNYANFALFLKQLSDSGIVYRTVVNGSSTTFLTTGNVTKYNNSQTDPAKKINRANLELEWWNGACTWSYWNTTNQNVSLGTISDNDFYEGWYKNMGTTIDTIAARDQVIFSDRILLHDYVNGIPTYSYANAQSTGATGGRLDIIAKGARQANKKIDLFIIISSENTAWGAANTFTGPALAQARIGGADNPYQYIEQQSYNNIVLNMTSLQKQWINFKGFIWFTKRYCYYAVPPK
jgi:hypothetical protein